VNVPRLETVTVLLAPFVIVPLSNTPSAVGEVPDVAVCGALSRLVHVIVVPTPTVIVAGAYLKSLICTWSTAAAATLRVAVAAPSSPQAASTAGVARTSAAPSVASRWLWNIEGIDGYCGRGASPDQSAADGSRLALRGASARHARGYGGRVSVLGLDHVQVAAPPGCEPQARRFYGELIGLAELAKPEPLRGRGGVWFSLGAQQLHVAGEEAFSPARKAHPALRVEPAALDALANRLVTGGATVAWDDALPGLRRFYTHDPWGNRVELLAEASV
jgi:catechol 2,3-dioxygenase-like lactoylglutathione lyase family enzyme